MKLNVLALALAAVVSVSANAAVEDSWSVGINGGWNHAFERDDASLSDQNGLGFSVNGEYNFTDWFGLGIDYTYLGGTKAVNASFHDNAFGLYSRFALPLDNQGSDLFFKAGYAWNKTSINHDDFYHTSPVLGIGGQWAVSDNLAFRAGYDYKFTTVHKHNIFGNSKVDNGYLYVGLQYNFGGAEPVAAPAPAPEQKTVRVTENHNLSAGLLFPFDGSTLSAEGKQAIADVVNSSSNLQNTEYEVYGYTDRIGSDAYNNTLSQKRADAVANQLTADGVNTIKTVEGRGKSSPVTGNKCDSVKGRQAVIDCLAADRRVEIIVSGDTTTEKVEQE